MDHMSWKENNSAWAICNWKDEDSRLFWRILSARPWREQKKLTTYLSECSVCLRFFIPKEILGTWNRNATWLFLSIFYIMILILT